MNKRNARNAEPWKKALYQNTVRYAKEHGEIAQLRASHEANIACRDAIEAAIREGYDGKYLTPNVEGVLEQFGPERVTHVLAATLRDRTEDVRFSTDTMKWAASVPMFDTGNRHYDYAINSHSVLLDSFVSMMRKEMAAWEQRSQAAEKPSIKARLAESKAAQAERPAVRQHQQDKEAR